MAQATFDAMQMMSSYRNYWLHQATAHPDLGHTEAAKVFGMVGIEEAIGDFRGKVQPKGWILRVIEYSYRPVLDESGRYLKQSQGGFIIARYYDERNGGEAARHAALDAAEAMNDQLIEKMMIDSGAGHPLWNHSLTSRQQIRSEVVDAVGDMSYIGWRTIFTWSGIYRDCVPSLDLPDWEDGGVTPFDL